MQVLYPGRIEFRVIGFCGGRKTEEPEKNPQDENQQQTQLTYGTEPESIPSYVSGRRTIAPSLLPGNV